MSHLFPPPIPKKTLNSSPASFFYSLQLHLYFSTIKATIINILQQQWIKWECENNSLFSRQVYSFSLLLYWCCWPQQWAVFSGKKNPVPHKRESVEGSEAFSCSRAASHFVCSREVLSKHITIDTFWNNQDKGHDRICKTCSVLLIKRFLCHKLKS